MKLQLKNISALREKIESLRKDYYSLPVEIDLSESDTELEQLEDCLDKTEDIQLADPEFFKPGKVPGMLLGAEVFFRILKYEKIQIGESIVLQGSVFGFLVTGKLPISQPIKSCLFIKK
ncbi:hypothetical protein TNCT_384331 [Trichonephila clavata]|uniref:Uncharacterized protein n=1 Tax=Trichonephila clavata TaxID=2740835 RepID=A0A8X6LIW5_TRICU|nr:hypothetical protein TNCT_384331 [Trichonephila clavata]